MFDTFDKVRRITFIFSYFVYHQKLTLSASTMQIYWETFSKALTQEKDEILRMHEAIRSQVNIISDEVFQGFNHDFSQLNCYKCNYLLKFQLIKRQTLVNQDRQEKQRAEEENLAFAKLSMVSAKFYGAKYLVFIFFLCKCLGCNQNSVMVERYSCSQGLCQIQNRLQKKTKTDGTET